MWNPGQVRLSASKKLSNYIHATIRFYHVCHSEVVNFARVRVKSHCFHWLAIPKGIIKNHRTHFITAGLLVTYCRTQCHPTRAGEMRHVHSVKHHFQSSRVIKLVTGPLSTTRRFKGKVAHRWVIVLNIHTAQVIMYIVTRPLPVLIYGQLPYRLCQIHSFLHAHPFVRHCFNWEVSANRHIWAFVEQPTRVMNGHGTAKHCGCSWPLNWWPVEQDTLTDLQVLLCSHWPQTRTFVLTSKHCFCFLPCLVHHWRLKLQTRKTAMGNLCWSWYVEGLHVHSCPPPALPLSQSPGSCSAPASTRQVSPKTSTLRRRVSLRCYSRWWFVLWIQSSSPQSIRPQ